MSGEREEREVPKPYIVGKPTLGIRRWRPLRGRFVLSVSIPGDQRALIEKLEELASLEKTNVSELIRRAIKEYVERHREGNPQSTLFPHMKPWEMPPVEKRRENLEWMESLVERNPGKFNEILLVSVFSRLSGLKRETCIEYLKTLKMAGFIVSRGGRLYHRNNVPM